MSGLGLYPTREDGAIRMSDNSPRDLPQTRWSLIARAAEEDRDALGALLRLYIPALRSYLVFGKGIQPHDADDIVQSFLVQKVLSRPLIASARQDRGRFRSLVLSALDNFCIDWWRRGKQRVERDAVPLDDELVQQQEAPAVPQPVETHWAAEVIREALRRMEEHCRATDQVDCWEIFSARVLGPALDGKRPESYASMVGRLQVASPREAANRLTTAKNMFKRCLRQTIEGYVRSRPEEIDEEMAELKKILNRAEEWPVRGKGHSQESEESR